MENIMLFLAGLGIFIVSMDLMGKNMQTLLGSSVRDKMQKLSNKRIFGVIMGGSGTVALQSSTAMIVLLLSFVQIGVLSIVQSLPIVIGIDLGASVIFVTLLASAFNVSIILSALALVGAFIRVFANSTKAKAVGNVLFAFGILFLGLYLISYSMSGLKSLDFMNTFLVSCTNPIWLVLIGVLLSLLTQSSLATNAIIISLCAGVGGDIGMALQSALWMSLGSRIGPTSAGLLASLGKHKSAKCVAVFHTLFNVSTLLLFALSVPTGWTVALENAIQNPVLVIVLVNIIASFATGLVMFFLVKPMSFILPKILPSKKGVRDLYEIEERLFSYPELCIGQIGKQYEYLFTRFTNNLNNLMAFCIDEESKISIDTIKNENARLYEDIDKVKLNLTKLNQGLSDNEKSKLSYYIDVIGRFNSLADRTKKIAGLFPKKPTKQFTKEQVVVLAELFGDLVRLGNMAKETITVINDGGNVLVEVVDEVYKIDESVTEIKLKIKEMIIKRYINASTRSAETDKYARLINQLEQIGEHYSTISLLGYNMSEVDEQEATD